MPSRYLVMRIELNRRVRTQWNSLGKEKISCALEAPTQNRPPDRDRRQPQPVARLLLGPGRFHPPILAQHYEYAKAPHKHMMLRSFDPRRLLSEAKSRPV